MKHLSQNQIKTATLMSLICLLIPLSVYGLWIYAFDLGTSQAERVAIFNDFFPAVLSGKGVKAYISIVFGISSIVLSSISLRSSSILLKVLNIIILFFSSIVLLLNLFSML